MPTLTNSDSLSSPPPLVCYWNNFYEWCETHYRELPPDLLRIRLTRFLKTEGLSRLPQRLVENAIACIKAECLLEGDRPLPFYIEFGEDGCLEHRKYLALSNGIIDIGQLERGTIPTLIPHTPNWISTTVLPFCYDRHSQAPGWDTFLNQALKCQGDGDKRIRVLQEWFGYNLLPDARFQKFVLLQGQGENGKTVVINILRRLLGPENTSQASLEQLGSHFGLQGLIGKVANICGDFSETSKLDEGKLKELTGGETVCVPRKYLPDATLQSGIKLTFACNTLPLFNDKSSGLWRRLLLIPFYERVSKENKNDTLVDDLAVELPGILNWALEGLKRLLNQKHFTACEVCDVAVAEHRIACNPSAQFLEVTLPTLFNQQRTKMSSSDLYHSFCRWCKSYGYTIPSHRTFVQNVQASPEMLRHWKCNGLWHFQFKARKKR